MIMLSKGEYNDPRESNEKQLHPNEKKVIVASIPAADFAPFAAYEILAYALQARKIIHGANNYLELKRITEPLEIGYVVLTNPHFRDHRDIGR